MNNPEMESEAARRLSICVKCVENSTPDEIRKSSTCKKCGCFLGAKSFSKNSKCPIGKW
jgi:predicted Zn-ribbon and HTH transcriptional regulator